MNVYEKFEKLVKDEGRTVQVGVEGLNFLHFIREKIQNDPDYNKICLWDYKTEPADELDDWLEMMALNSDRGFTAVGVISDIDNNTRQARESSIQYFLKKHYSRDVQEELVIEKGQEPSLGYFIIPQNQSEGCLETALLENPTSKYFSCADEYVQCVTAIKEKNDNKKAKMLVRAMTIAEDPDMSFAATANKGLWDWNGVSLSTLLDFLKNINKES